MPSVMLFSQCNLMNRIARIKFLICLCLAICIGFACSKSKPQSSAASNEPSSQIQTGPQKELDYTTDPTCCGLMSVGNQGIDKAWRRFTANGRYRLALKEEIKSPAKEFGSDALNSIFAYCWGRLGYDSSEEAWNHLAAIVVNTSRNDDARFGLVIFSSPKAGDGSYQPYWIYQDRDLSRTVVWTGTGDLMIAEYKEDGSRAVSYVQWDSARRRFVTSKSRPRPA